MSGTQRCPSCHHGEVRIFFEAVGVPVNSCILLPTPQAARAYPRGDIRLGFCASCGFIYNTAFDPTLAEYDARYEETQGYSPTFRQFHRELAERLIERYDLRGKNVVEIGCGKGEFLNLLCELGGNSGVGFDPSHHAGRNESAAAERIEFVQDFYSEKYTDRHGDFVCCKMTLEHIRDTSNFVGMVRRSVGEDEGCIVYFLVPDAERILIDCATEDIYYEHCSYFVAGALLRLFAQSGFEVLRCAREYAGQYLSVEAKSAINGALVDVDNADLDRITELVDTFSQRVAVKTSQQRKQVSDVHGRGGRTILWGSGSKAVSFLTTVIDPGAVEFVVDINPHRQGCFMPGTAQRIVAPEYLREYRPDLVVIMNAVYRDEIERDLSAMNLRPEIVAL